MYELLKDKKDSKLHGIDPWIDHKEYSEYKDGNIT